MRLQSTQTSDFDPISAVTWLPANAYYCLDLECDIDSLRKLDDVELAERLVQEPKPVRRLKINASPLLYPLWDIDADRFLGQTEEELTRRASSVRADDEFMTRIARAAALHEPVYAPSEHIELQIYGGNFFSDADGELCRRFHALPWEARPDLMFLFADGRLRRLARRLIYFERPDLLNDAERQTIAADIALRRRGEGKYVPPQWTTIATALAELETMGEETSDAFKRSFRDLR
ncbi:hypothetical protein [Bradyrhizobium sp. LB11.1]|uniref:hypothetical protein n=1 Tax=Bradyrhizobium sp. LB11.1 TaxID=3156326 RepID=UPI003395ED11